MNIHLNHIQIRNVDYDKELSNLHEHGALADILFVIEK